MRILITKTITKSVSTGPGGRAIPQGFVAGTIHDLPEERARGFIERRTAIALDDEEIKTKMHLGPSQNKGRGKRK